MIQYIKWLCCIIFFFGIGCGSHKTNNNVISYTDQNNNRYFLSATSFEYNPITKAESSSGTYEGGISVTGKITSETFTELLTEAEEIMRTAPQDVRREMMTSILSISAAGNRTSRILRKSKKRTAFETRLVAIKKRLQ